MANWNNQFMSKRIEEDEKSQLISLINEEVTEYEEVTALVCQYLMPYVCKEPRNTSVQTGNSWVQEIMARPDCKCYEMFRVEKHVFYRLCHKLVEHGLESSRYVGVQEMVAMFLHTVGHGQCNRLLQERFQHSGETISRLFHKVLVACYSLSREIIKPSDPMFKGCHEKIRDDARYYPFFQNAIGAIDGTHIRCVVNERVKDKYIGRKGYPTQNVMAVCDWDMCFTFVLAGWEGSAHDARVFHTALSTTSMNFPHPPQGKYYLVDSGYPTPVGYLGPYRRERYHLPEFRRQPGFRNPNETFNYYHSSLRCTIERTFGVWKNKFQILQNMRKFSFPTQVYIVCATMAIHNFIRRNSRTDIDFLQVGNEGGDDHEQQNYEASSSNSTMVSSPQMNHLRDTIRDEIAESMRRN